ncbi:MAG: hypothetical protein FJZ62_02155 [Chlamydiae bacterium]|nr:hypothetical protein [Chlamydiota bacterium]
MISIIDSGVGGLSVYKEVKKIRPDLRTIYVADNKNFPYGTKFHEEILKAVEEIEQGLRTFCLEKVFVACHTASIALENQSCNHGLITKTTKKMIEDLDGKGSIAILGSISTINSGFYQGFLRQKGFEKVEGFGLQDLIALIEKGVTDKALLSQTLEPLIPFAPKYLLLASTHFPHVESLVLDLFPFAKILNPSKQFALEIASQSTSPSKNDLKEDLFITTKHDPKFLHTLQKNPINNLLKKDVKRV